MDTEQFRKAGYQAIDRICDYYYSIEDKPVIPDVKPGYLREALPNEAPIKGEDFQDIADDYQKFIVPGLTHWQHPSFFAYFPAAGTFEGMLGDLYASSTTNPGFNWGCSPACTELESIVMDWAAKLFAFNPAFYTTSGVGGGVIQTTASESALTVVVAARSRYLRQYPSVPTDDLVIYTTTQTHSLGKKAGLVLGLAVRAIPVTTEDNFALRGKELKRAIEEDLKNGKKPFILIASMGTTSSGAIDNFEEAGLILQQYYPMWLHIDAAWAGTMLACPEFRERAQLPAANTYTDSICVNFHKCGLTNFDCSGLWVRDRKNLTDALDITPIFLRTQESDAGTVVDYRNWSITLGRRFRSLKLWFVLRSFGVEGFQNYIRKSVKLNEHFVDLIRAEPDLFELVTPPSFSLSVFRIIRRQPFPGTSREPSAEQLNALNCLFYRKLAARTDLMLTQTDLNGVNCMRFAVGAQRTEKVHIEKALSAFKEVAGVCIKEWEQQESGCIQVADTSLAAIREHQSSKSSPVIRRTI